MTTKNYFGGAIINSGIKLPTPITTVPFGALFMLIAQDGTNAPGLYFFGYQQDIDAGLLGNQGALDWYSLDDISGQSDASTLGGQPPSYYQVADTDLAALAATSTTGLYTVTGTGTSATRSIAIVNTTDSGLSISNGNGVAGNPTITLTPANIQLSSLGGTLSNTRGGTGSTANFTAGGVAFGSSSTVLGTSAAGAVSSGSGTAQNWQILSSTGTGAPAWINSTGLNVAYATVSGSTLSSGTAAFAGTTVWSGIQGDQAGTVPIWNNSVFQSFSNAPAAGFTIRARPSLFYDFGNSGVLSGTPAQFAPGSISGFDAFNTSDMGQYQVGLTVMGLGAGGSRAMQLSANWNFEENPPSGLRFRVNDDTGTVTAWGPWATLWDSTNFTPSNYVLKSGDTMTGSLTTTALAVGTAPGAVGTISASSSITATGNLVTNTGNVVVTAGNVRVPDGSVGAPSYTFSADTNTGIYTNGPNGNNVAIAVAGVQGAIFTASGFDVNGDITATGNITAYSSDARLKKNVEIIENAVDKVVSLGGYSYDWDLAKCEEVGFKPANEHEHGLIAQEVEKVMPDAVAPAPFDKRYKTVRYDRIVALLTAAIGEQQKQIDLLKAEVESLKR